MHKYLLFISDFRPVVNFNYVSSPKLVLSRKVLLMPPLAYQSFYFLKLSNQTEHEIILCDTLYNRLSTNAVYTLAKTEFPCRI